VNGNGKEVTTIDAVLPIQMTLDLRAERIRTLLNAAGTCIIEAGLQLIEAKKQCDHGKWLPWLEREFNWKESTAKNLMQIATAFSNRQHVGDLPALDIPMRALLALSKPGVPQEVRDEAIEKAEKGEKITIKKAEEMVAEAIAQKAKEAEAEQEELIATFEQKLTDTVKKLETAHEGEKEQLVAQVGDMKLKVADLKKKKKPAASEKETPEEEARQEERRQRVATNQLGDVLSFLNPRKKSPEAWAKELMSEVNPALLVQQPGRDLSPQCVKSCGAAFAAFVKLWTNKGAKKNGKHKRNTKR
jgi:Protein of unknown function (DUF3102)